MKKPSNQSVRIQITLPSNIAAKLAEVAASEHRTQSQQVHHLIKTLGCKVIPFQSMAKP